MIPHFVVASRDIAAPSLPHRLRAAQILTAVIIANNLSIQVSSTFVNQWGSITASRSEGVVNLQSAKQSAAVAAVVNGGCVLDTRLASGTDDKERRIVAWRALIRCSCSPAEARPNGAFIILQADT